MNWEDKEQVKKGNLGEKYAHDFLTKRGFIVYKPITNGAHKIDYFAHHGQKKHVIAVDAKAKKRMATKEKTGFNHNCYLHYKELEEKHNMRTYVYFVDDFEECVYGQWLSKLSEGEVITNKYDSYKTVIVWPLSEMDLIRWLSEEEVVELKKHSQKDNYDYSRVERHFKKEEVAEKTFTIPEDQRAFYNGITNEVYVVSEECYMAMQKEARELMHIGY